MKIHSRVFYLILVLVLPFPTLAHAEGPVWRVEKNGEVVYLGGTVHMLRPGDLPLPEAFNRAYAASERLILETDVGHLDTPEGQARLLRLMRADPGQSLSQILSMETYGALAQAFQARNMDIRMVESLKPSMAVVTLQVAEFRRLGLGMEGVDKIFYQRAREDGMVMEYLETMDEQFRYLSSMGEGWEDEFVRLSLRDLEESADLLDPMIRAWRSGNLQQIDALLVAEMRRDYPSAHETLLVQRNRTWLPRIEQLFREPGTELVMVGAAHLAGEEGLLRLLKERGYSIHLLQE